MIAQWYKTNISMLQRLFGKVSYDNYEYTWILIHRFRLPPFYNRMYSALLITTPGYNINNKFAFSFYLDKNLRRSDIPASRFIFDDFSYNPLRHKNYARLCFNIKKFQPRSDVLSGDNIVDLCQSVYNFLARKKGA